MGKTINSRRKGKVGELELAHYLTEKGYNARRGQQFSGANGDPDVIGLSGVHIECKRVERLDLDAALGQSVRDARAGEVPVVIHRKNRQKWRVTMLLDDFLDMYGGGANG